MQYNTVTYQTHLIPEKVSLSLQLVDALHVGHVSSLEGGEIWVEVSKLDAPKLAQVRDTSVRRVLVDDDRHIGHVFRAEPSRHGSLYSLKFW